MIKKIIFLLIVSLLSLNLISSRSTPWSTDLNNNSEYYDVMNQLKNNQTLINETQLTPEQKEELRIRNNLEIARLTNTLTPNQSEQLKLIERQERIDSRKDNNELIFYVIIGLIIVIFIFWIAISNS